MRIDRFCGTILLTSAVIGLTSCGNRRPQPPTLEELSQALSVSFPADSQTIGGTQTANNAWLCLVVSNEPLPLPEQPGAKKRRKRPEGEPFPTSALLNLMAACKVSAEDLPTLKGQRGVSHQGQSNGAQFTYREAETDEGWLTAIELFQADLGN